MRAPLSPKLPPALPPALPIDTTMFKPGLRLAVGLSGGADSVALLCALSKCSGSLGLVLHAAHLHHGLRGAEADSDLEFARALAASLGLPFHESKVDTTAEAAENGESIEAAARRLRYGWFRQLMASREVEAVATAHTHDDQAETVLSKFLRGAWTAGLSGIHPVIEFPEGRVLRPLLHASRADVEAYLTSLGQDWREDSSNRDSAFTRNRIRHELLPLLEGWNPRLRDHLAQMAALARDEEMWWQAELARLAPQLLMPGRPVRGGGRAAAAGSPASLALDVTRLAALPTATQRRLLRHAAEQLGAAPDFTATEVLRMLALTGRSGQRCELAQGLTAERTPRELRLMIGSPSVALAASKSASTKAVPEYSGSIPGEISAPAFGLRLQIAASSPAIAPAIAIAGQTASTQPVPTQPATLRNWRPGDRVRPRYSSGPRKVKEVLERMRVTGTSRVLWPVLEVGGRIVWMKGVELEPELQIEVLATTLDADYIELM